MTGLGTKFSSVVLSLAGGNLILLGILSGAICLILGMGLPTTAAYIIAVTVAAPAIIQAGVPPLAAHLFVFYYAILSAITPGRGGRLCRSRHRGGQHHANGLYRNEAALVAYIIPFFLLYSQTLMLEGSALDILLALATATIGITALCVGLSGCPTTGIRSTSCFAPPT